MREADVLIVGGGAAGLTASMLLSTYGISSHLVSKYPGTSRLPKAHLLSIKTMEIFGELGVEDAIRAVSCPDEHMRYVGWYAGMAGPDPDAGRRIARFGAWGRGRQEVDWVGASDNAYTNLTQSRLEPLLKARAEELAPGGVHFNHNFLSFTEDEHGVVADIDDRASGERYQVRARYLLACDGGRSVNAQIGVEMEGQAAMATTISLHFSADLSRWARDPEVLIRTILSPELGYPAVLVPMGPDKWGPESTEWVFHLMSLPGDHKRHDEATAVAEMKKAFGLPELEVQVHMITYWPLDAVVASRFRVGRAFVVGDAAHRMPPAGGHGLNTAVQDTYNLCWKLAAVLHGHAGRGLLDSYEAERRPLAQRTVAAALHNWINGRQVAAGFGFSAAQSCELNWRNLKTLWRTGPEGDAARRRANDGLAANTPTYNHLDLSFGHSYAVGALVPESAAATPPQDGAEAAHAEPASGQAGAVRPDGVYRPSTVPGHSLPHAWLDDVDGSTATGQLVARGRFTLLAGEEGDAWCDAARLLAGRHGWPLDAFTIGTTTGDWLDNRREWACRSGVGTAGAVLVRPDRFVAWRSAHLPADPVAALEGALLQVLAAERSDRPAPRTARAVSAATA